MVTTNHNKPQTELGKALAEIREKIVASGEKLLSAEEINLRLGRVSEDDIALIKMAGEVPILRERLTKLQLALDAIADPNYDDFHAWQKAEEAAGCPSTPTLEDWFQLIAREALEDNEVSANNSTVHKPQMVVVVGATVPKMGTVDGE